MALPRMLRLCTYRPSLKTTNLGLTMGLTIGLALCASALLCNHAHAQETENTAADTLSSEQALPFGDDLGLALSKALEDKKVTVVSFGATWCTWCKKIDNGAFKDPRVVGLADRFHWVKIDIDVKRDVAAMFGVRQVPQTYLLNIHGETIATHKGFVDADGMLALLMKHVGDGQAEGEMTELLTFFKTVEHDLKSDDAAVKTKAVVQLLDKLVHPGFRARRYAISLIQKAGDTAHEPLLEGLNADELRRRAAAAQTLNIITDNAPNYDPFAEQTLREKMIEQWRLALKTQTEKAEQSTLNSPAQNNH